jgi:hypothetical protein
MAGDSKLGHALAGPDVVGVVGDMSGGAGQPNVPGAISTHGQAFDPVLAGT